MQSGTNNPTALAAGAWLARVSQLKQRLQQTPNAGIPELQLISEEDWLAAVKDRHLDTELEYRRALSTLRNAAENQFAGMINIALQKYLQANGKQFPTDLAQLQPYFDSPVDVAILQRWEIVPAKTIPSLGFGLDSIITEKTAVDDLFDQRMAIGSNGYGITDFLSTTTREVMKPVYQAFSTANNGETIANHSQLLPYATTAEQQAAVQKWVQRDLLNK